MSALDNLAQLRASVAQALSGGNPSECCCDGAAPYGRWHVAVTQFREESLARDAVNAAGLSAFLPMRLEGLGRNQFWRPLLPGYLFVLFDPAGPDWRGLYRTRGIRRLLGTDPMRPEPVPTAAVERLMRAADKRQAVAEPARALIEAGVRVRVMDGLLAGSEGVVRRSGARRCLVQLDGVAFVTTLPAAVLMEMEAA